MPELPDITVYQESLAARVVGTTLVRVRIAGNRYPGWIHLPGQAAHKRVTEIDSYRQTA